IIPTGSASKSRHILYIDPVQPPPHPPSVAASPRASVAPTSVRRDASTAEAPESAGAGDPRSLPDGLLAPSSCDGPMLSVEHAGAIAQKDNSQTTASARTAKPAAVNTPRRGGWGGQNGCRAARCSLRPRRSKGS